MLDAVDPVVLLDRKTVECPSCGTAFKPKRSNQRYCSRTCQQRTSRNASRGDRSKEHKERSRKHYERAARLREMIYTAPPEERLGVMKDILSFIPTDSGLRNILTDPELHAEKAPLGFAMNIAKAANASTQKFCGVSIKKYLRAVRSGEEPPGIPLR